MNAVVGQVRRTVESIRDKVLKDLLKRQKPELDRKVDEMLKPSKVNQIRIKFTGRGLGLGRRLSRVGRGLSLVKRLF